MVEAGELTGVRSYLPWKASTRQWHPWWQHRSGVGLGCSQTTSANGLLLYAEMLQLGSRLPALP